MAFTFRGSNPSVTEDALYKVPILRYPSSEAIGWAALIQSHPQGVRIIVQKNPDVLPLDVLYIPRAHPRLLVGLHGLENRAKADLPKFQFQQSFVKNRDESLLFLSDSTLLHDDRISIAWMCGDSETDIAAEYAKLIRLLGEQTGIKETVLVGHSAGGTAAIKIGTAIPNSRAIAVNSQLSAEYFAGWTLTNLRAGAFPFLEDNEKLLNEFRVRLDLRARLQTRVENSTFTWFTHISDEASTTDYPNFPNLIKFLGLGKNGGVTQDGDAVVLCNWESPSPSNHALPGTILPFLRAVLGEDPEFDIAIIGDISPQWRTLPRRGAYIYRGSDLSTTHDELYGAEIYRYQRPDEVPWKKLSRSPGTPVRLIVQSDPNQLPLDVLYIPREHTRLLVGLHGAESQSNMDLPKFQFVRSFSFERSESLLFLSDTSMLADPKLNICWMAGNERFDVAAAYAELIQGLTEATGITETVLAGHSAGGTAAVRIGAMVPSSHAIAINGQFAAELYFPWAVTALRELAFPQYSSNEGMLSALRDRLDLRSALSTREVSSTFTWFAHIGDGSSFGDNPSFPELVRYLELPSHGGVSRSGDRVVLCDWHTEQESKHGLPGSIMPFIRFALNEDPRFDLNIITA